MDPVSLCSKYLSLRSEKAGERFFLNWNSTSKKFIQNMGPNSLQEIPRDIAKSLQLANVSDFTFHCFRRSGATSLADNGLQMLDIQRAGRWKSSKVVEGMTNKFRQLIP